MDGIQLAKACGVVFGRSKQLTPAQVAELHERCQQGVRIRTLMQDYQISKATVYRYLHTENAPTEGVSAASRQ
jgi:DNA invertase Pin-like site-specific DNA recombinase